MNTKTQMPENIVDITNLIFDSLDGEPLEVAQFMMKRELVANMARMAITMGRKDTPNIMPEILIQVLEADDSLINNQFYVDNFAVLKFAMNKSGRDLATKAHFLEKFTSEKDNEKKKQYGEALLALSSSFLSGVVDVIFLSKGREAAQVFDISLKSLTHAGKTMGDF